MLYPTRQTCEGITARLQPGGLVSGVIVMRGWWPVSGSDSRGGGDFAVRYVQLVLKYHFGYFDVAISGSHAFFFTCAVDSVKSEVLINLSSRDAICRVYV